MRIPMRQILEPEDPVVIASMQTRSPEVLISGPRNCAKTFFNLLFLLALHESYENLQSIVIRSVMADMASVWDSLNYKILRYGMDDKRNPFRYLSSSKSDKRPHLLFDNGGKMAFGGMDKSSKILGGEYDIALYNQGEQEYNMSHISDLLGCMEGGRAGNWVEDGEVCYQLRVDANPSIPKHILMERVEHYGMERFDYTHKSRPDFYDWDTNSYTRKGDETIEGLLRAYPEGFERERMVFGKWKGAEGRVYKQYIPKNHRKPIRRGDISEYAEWHLSCDFGNISSNGIWARTDDVSIRFKEIYRKGLSPLDIVGKIKSMQSEYNIPEFDNVVTDHEFSGRSIMADAGFDVKLANKRVSVKDGIAIVQRELSNDRLIINANSLDEPCPEIGFGTNCLHDEFIGLSYKDDAKMTGSGSDDLPDPQYPDHAADETRYHKVSVVSRPELPSFLI